VVMVALPPPRAAGTLPPDTMPARVRDTVLALRKTDGYRKGVHREGSRILPGFH
jgi:hypothetical protein